MTDESGFRHGGDRRHVGIYPTAEEAAKYKEACKEQGVTQSFQGRQLINAWVAIIEKEQKKASK